jgi:hypothetical protein
VVTSGVTAGIATARRLLSCVAGIFTAVGGALPTNGEAAAA